MENAREQARQKLEQDALEIELFHIIHKAIYLINEGREAEEQVGVLDREIGEAVKVILLEDISRSLNRLLLAQRDEDFERYADIGGFANDEEN